ncbi:MAG TPA: ABC transporter permease [Chthoniobacterales bacterium]
MSEIRFAFRQLRKSPVFTLVAIATLALGIGANSAIFTVINGVLLRPLPYPQPDQLVTLASQQSAPELADIREQSHAFVAVGGVSGQAADYTGGTEPVQVELGLVAGDFFQVFGTRTELGRTLVANDDRLGGALVIVLTDKLWQRQFGSDARILGKSITVAGQNYTVVGVTSPDFLAPHPSLEAFVPIHVFYPAAAKSRGAHLLRAYARLRPGMTLPAAQSELRLIDRRMAQANPDEDKNRESTLVSLQEKMVGDIRPALLVLCGAVGLVLLIACSNFANLLLVRGAQRRPELALRSTLGAGRWHLVRQVLLESVLLAVLGGCVGLLVGGWGVDALLAFKPEELPRVENIRLDGGVLVFTFGLSVLTGLLFGILPAWQATRVDANSVLAASSRSVTPTRSLGRNLFVTAQLALALVLLIGAGLLGKTFHRLTNISPGFDPQDVLNVRIELPEARYREIPAQTRFRDQVLDNLNALPQTQAAMISELPLSGSSISHNFIIEGRPPVSTGDEPELGSRSIEGDYFKVMQIPVLRGRSLNRNDRANTPTVGVINDAMARKYFPGQDPLGQRIRWARAEGVSWITIVGVVGDVRHFGLGQAEEPSIYTAYAQSGQSWKRWSEIVVRAPKSIPRETVAREIKAAIWQVDPLLAVTQARSMSEVVAVSLAAQRFNAFLLAAFAATALLLASVGLYGVLAFGVAQRTREIGIRIAVGAQAGDVLKLVLGQGFTLALIGVAAGVVGSLLGTRALSGLLYGVTPTDPATFAALSLLLLFVAGLAGYLPARRAMKIDPNITLRHE